MPDIFRHLIHNWYKLAFVLIISLCGAIIFLASSLAATTVTINAPIDGSDASASIQAQIDAAPNGATIIFPVGKNQGRYRVDHRIVVKQRSGLTFQGPSPSNPATFWTDKTGLEVDPAKYKYVDGKSTRSHWRIEKSSNITLKNLRIEGPNDYRDAEGYTSWTYDGGKYEGEHGFVTLGGSNITIEDSQIDSVFGDGVAANNASGVGTVGVTVRRVTTTSNGRHGFSTQSAHNVLIDGLRVVKGGSNGISFEPNAIQETVENVEVKNSVIDTRVVALAHMGSRSSSDIWIHDNVVEHAIASWPMFVSNPNDGVSRRRNLTFERNKQLFQSTAGYGISIVRTDGIVIRDNEIPTSNKSKAAAINLEDVGGTLTIRNNAFAVSPAVYIRDGVVHAGGLDACGNTTKDGGDQPVACPAGTEPVVTPEPGAPPTAPTTDEFVTNPEATNSNVGSHDDSVGQDATVINERLKVDSAADVPGALVEAVTNPTQIVRAIGGMSLGKRLLLASMILTPMLCALAYFIRHHSQQDINIHFPYGFATAGHSAGDFMQPKTPSTKNHAPVQHPGEVIHPDIEH